MYLNLLLLAMTLITFGNDLDQPSEIITPEFCKKNVLQSVVFIDLFQELLMPYFVNRLPIT